MENTQPKRNYLPLIIFLLIIGIGAAAIAKPTPSIKDSSTALSTNLTPKSNAAYATFCETAWPTEKGQTASATQNSTPNVPNFGVGEHVCGNPNAKLIIVEYTDLECPFCKQFHPTLEQLVADSNGQIAWVLRHYPIDELHSRARHEAEAAECAGEQLGEVGFWKFTDRVFEVTTSNNTLAPELLPAIAAEIGLDKTAFTTCLSSGKYLPKIAAQAALAEANGHSSVGTPNSRIILNGKEVDEVKGAVDLATLKAKTDLWFKVAN